MQQQKIARTIVQEGDPVLRTPARPITKAQIGSPEIKKLIMRMRQLLVHEENGVGLAASQAGVPVAIFIVAGRVFDENDGEKANKNRTSDKQQASKTKLHPQDKIFINPELIRTSRKKEEMSEGCLSVRGKYGTVMRHAKASIKAFDEDGTQITYHGTGLLAHIFQHEIDHLRGILFVDKAVTLDDNKKVDKIHARVRALQEHAA